MRNLAVIVAGAVLLAGMLQAGGCVAQSEYDKVKAQNANAQEQLVKWQDRARLAENDNATLRGELAGRDSAIKTRDDMIANLNNANGKLRQDLDAAYKKLQELGQVKPGPALPGPLNDALMKFAAEHGNLLTYDANNGMVKFSADLTFTPGSADISPAATAALKKFADILNLPDAKPFNVYVAGHTDDIPIKKEATKEKFEDNWGLSLGRAKSVVKALYGDGVGQERMGAMGFSKYHPVAPNAPGNKGNTANRRVELWIVPNTLMLTGMPLAPSAPPAHGAAAPETGD